MSPSASISVIVPVYNTEKYISEALQSILAQTLPPKEIVIVDDGSTDKTRDVISSVKSPLIEYHHQKNAGIGAARNKGIEVSTGDYLAFLDADDLWKPGKLELQMEIFTQDPETDAVFGHLEQFVSPDVSPEFAKSVKAPESPDPGYHASVMLVKRDSFFKVGLFSTQFLITEFIDWCSKAKEKGLKTAMPSAVVASRRIHEANSVSKSTEETHKDYLKAIRERLKRKQDPSS